MSQEQKSYEQALLEKAYVRIVPPLNLREVSPSLINEDKLILYQDDSSRLDDENENNAVYAIGSEAAIMHYSQYEE